MEILHSAQYPMKHYKYLTFLQQSKKLHEIEDFQHQSPDFNKLEEM